MALVKENIDAQDLELAKILLELHGNFVHPVQFVINTNTTTPKPMGNQCNNLNIIRVTSGPSAVSTPKGIENIPLENGHMKGDVSPSSNNLPPKKRQNTFQRERDHSEHKRLLPCKLQKLQTRDVGTQTEESYFTAPRKEEIDALYAELDRLREELRKTKLNGFASDRTYSGHSSASGEDVQTVRQRDSTSSNERPRARYQRKAKSLNTFCNGSVKTEREESVDDDDSDYQEDLDEQEDEEHEIDDQDFDMSEDYVQKDKDREATVPIGRGHARVPTRVLRNIDWNGSFTTATRKLLTAVFPRSVLATHSLTGKQSPAFPNKAAKRKLNPLLVEDIIRTVVDKCNVKEAQVRTSITTKCADESKMLRNRLHNKSNGRKRSSCSR